MQVYRQWRKSTRVALASATPTCEYVYASVYAVRTDALRMHFHTPHPRVSIWRRVRSRGDRVMVVVSTLYTSASRRRANAYRLRKEAAVVARVRERHRWPTCSTASHRTAIVLKVGGGGTPLRQCIDGEETFPTRSGRYVHKNRSICSFAMGWPWDTTRVNTVYTPCH